MARKSAKLVANTKVHILASRSAKLTANFSATMVTSLPSFSLSLSLYLSLSPNVPHAQSLFLFPIVFGINLIQFFVGKNNIGLGRI